MQSILRFQSPASVKETTNMRYVITVVLYIPLHYLCFICGFLRELSDLRLVPIGTAVLNSE